MDFKGHELAHLNSDLNFRSLGIRRRVAKTQPCQRFKETPQCKSSFIINHQEFSWKTTTKNFRFQEHPFYTDMKPFHSFGDFLNLDGMTRHPLIVGLPRYYHSGQNWRQQRWNLSKKPWNVTLINSVRSWIVKRHCQPFLPQPLVVWHCHVNNNRCNKPSDEFLREVLIHFKVEHSSYSDPVILQSYLTQSPLFSLSLCG